MLCIIYCLKNTINNKVYVGQTWDMLKDRFGTNGNGYKECIHLYNAISLYGQDKFFYEILAVCESQEDADKLETFFGDTVFDARNRDKGYNIRGFGGSRGRHSEESKKKMSEAHQGKIFSQEHIENMRKVRLGVSLSETHKANISKSLKNGNAPWLGKHLSVETKNKIRDGNLGKILSQETKNKMSVSRTGEKNHQFGKEPANKTAISMEQELEIVENYQKGMSIKNLKKKFRIDQNRVKKVLNDNGISIRKVGKQGKCLKLF